MDQNQIFTRYFTEERHARISYRNLTGILMPVARGGSTGSIEPPLSQVEPPQPGPKVLFLNLHMLVTAYEIWVFTLLI